MFVFAGRCLRVGALGLVCAAALAACGSSSSSPTTTTLPHTSTTQATGASDASGPTTTYRGAPAPASGLSATTASRWACAYFTAIASATGTGAHPYVKNQAIFDVSEIAKYAAIADSNGGSQYAALNSDAQALVTYSQSNAIDWSQPESFWNGNPPNKVAADCRALVNTTAPVAP